MRKLFSLVAVLVLSSVSLAQGARIQPPQPNYKQYGSYSAQLTVYENAQRRLNELELEKYRRFREEVRRQTVTPTYVVTTSSGRSTTYCGDGLTAWRDRRDRRCGFDRSYRCSRGR